MVWGVSFGAGVDIEALGPHPERSRRVKGRACQAPASSFVFAQDEADEGSFIAKVRYEAGEQTSSFTTAT